MPHNHHTASDRNQDSTTELPHAEAYLERYAEALAMPSSFPPPVIQEYTSTKWNKGFKVVREDLLAVGSKCRFAEPLINSFDPETEIVYVAPRFGFAAVSLAWLCARMDRTLVLFMPSSKEISEHQAFAISMGAIPRFMRIAAMPNLNRVAKLYADTPGKNRTFLPLGLKHPLITAGIIRTARGLGIEPSQVWCAISTGVLSRALQLAWPDADHRVVAVSRNIHDGERGKARIYSHPRDFTQRTTAYPPFPSAGNYDAKVWDFMPEHGRDGALFWNVAGEVPKFDFDLVAKSIDSEREWGEYEDSDFTSGFLDVSQFDIEIRNYYRNSARLKGLI